MEAARLLQVPRQSIWEWVNGKNLPNALTLARLYQLSGGRINLELFEVSL